VTDLLALVETIEASAHPHALASELHGPRHWRDVARVGLVLCRYQTLADPLVVLAFAAAHDSQRHGDGIDSDHGPRAAEVVRHLHEQGALPLADEQAEQLRLACSRHTYAMADRPVSATAGACYDADRLTLWRLNIAPDETLLFTPWGKRLAQMEGPRELVEGDDVSWPLICQRYRKRDLVTATGGES
jgi:hypothetical protein